MKLNEICPIVDYQIGQYIHYLHFEVWKDNEWENVDGDTSYATVLGFVKKHPEYENAELVGILPRSETEITLYIK